MTLRRASTRTSLDRLPGDAFNHFDPDLRPAEIELDVVLHPDAPIPWLLECSPEVLLATYSELRLGKPCATRLRHTRRDEEGRIATDVMLTSLLRPVN